MSRAHVPLLLALLAAASGYVLSPALPRSCTSRSAGRSIAPPVAALDYKDPAVAEEFATIQALDTEMVEDELATSGVVAPRTMSDMDMRMMLVEMRLRKAGKIGSTKPAGPKKAPAGANAFETALYEKPAFKELYNSWQTDRNTNAMNLATEHLMNPRRTKERYGGTAKYDDTIKKIEDALNAKIVKVVTSGKVAYTGFPANMGKAGVEMTLAAFGALKSFSYEANDDGMTSSGLAEFDDSAAAKACIDKYDGMNMGLGTTLAFEAL